MWKVRLIGYAVGAGAAGAAAYGLCEYDPVTGMITIPPFSVSTVVGVLTSLTGNIMAFWAVVRGWTRK